MPMKNPSSPFLFAFALMLGLAATLLSASGAHAAERRYSAGNFQTVRVFGEFDVVIEPARTISIRAEGESILVNRVTVRSSNKVLTIRQRNVGVSPLVFGDKVAQGERIKIYIGAPEIRSVTYQGNGSLIVSALHGKQTAISLIGNGTALVQDVKSDYLDSNVNGEGVLTLAGTAREHKATMLGYGRLEALGLETQNAQIIAEGPVFAELSASVSASGLANEGADIVIIGTEDCAIRSPEKPGSYIGGFAPATILCLLTDDRLSGEDDGEIDDEAE